MEDFWYGMEMEWKKIASMEYGKIVFQSIYYHALVLGPWPWPRAFLSLASRVSVLGKAVLGLGFFLCPWPWPQALCPRLHLCALNRLCIGIGKCNAFMPRWDFRVSAACRCGAKQTMDHVMNHYIKTDCRTD